MLGIKKFKEFKKSKKSASVSRRGHGRGGLQGVFTDSDFPVSQVPVANVTERRNFTGHGRGDLEQCFAPADFPREIAIISNGRSRGYGRGDLEGTAVSYRRT